METDSEYKNRFPLTTGAARGLIVALFAGKGYHTKRDEIIKTLTPYHNENGGKATPKQKRVSAVKKALRDLEEQGLAEKHPSRPGYWRVPEQEKHTGFTDSTCGTDSAPPRDIASLSATTTQRTRAIANGLKPCFQTSMTATCQSLSKWATVFSDFC